MASAWMNLIVSIPRQAVPYGIPLRCVATYFLEANVLAPIGSVALRSNTATSKAVVVSFAKSSVQDNPINDENPDALPVLVRDS